MLKKLFAGLALLAAIFGVWTGLSFVYATVSHDLYERQAARPWVNSNAKVTILPKDKLNTLLVADALTVQPGSYALPKGTHWIANSINMDPDTRLVASDVTIVAKVINGGRILADGTKGRTAGAHGSEGGRVFLATGSETNVQIEAIGGSGAAGKRGSNGSDGRDGKCGGFGYEHAQGGGDGSPGGRGGAGGDGGIVIVVAPAEPSVLPAIGAGEPGPGGQGGSGGRGGRGCVGLGGSQATKSNGRAGSSGEAGTAGSNGSFQFFKVDPVMLGNRIREVKDLSTIETQLPPRKGIAPK